MQQSLVRIGVSAAATRRSKLADRVWQRMRENVRFPERSTLLPAAPTLSQRDSGRDTPYRLASTPHAIILFLLVQRIHTLLPSTLIRSARTSKARAVLSRAQESAENRLTDIHPATNTRASSLTPHARCRRIRVLAAACRLLQYLEN